MVAAHICVWCEEPLNGAVGAVPINTMEGERWQHRECALRSVLGGIGHQIAHEYWCLQRNDPDGGLSRRQSALMVAAMYDVVGEDEVAKRAAYAPVAASADPWESDPASSPDDAWGELEDLLWQDPEGPWLPPSRTDQEPGSEAGAPTA